MIHYVQKKLDWSLESVKEVFHQLKKGEQGLQRVSWGCSEIMDFKAWFSGSLKRRYRRYKRNCDTNHQSMKQSFLLCGLGQKNRIDYGLVASHQAALSNRTPWSVMLLTSIPNLPVDPDLHLKEPIYQMWTFDEQDSELGCPLLCRRDAGFVASPHSSDVVRFEAASGATS